MFERVIIPLDGSSTAERALPAAQELAALARIPLVIIRVVDTSSMVSSTTFAIGQNDDRVFARHVREQHAEAERYLDGIATTARDAGHPVETRVFDGAPADAIVGAADAGDLIVMSSHGRTGMSRWFVGSVAEAVTRKATASVLLVRSSRADG